MTGTERIIFISYAHPDFAVVKNLADLLNNALNNLGFKAWFDNDLPTNSIWKDELSKMIAHCDRFLHVTSPESVKSEWCQWELGQAIKLEKPILLMLLREIDSDHPLHKIHHINFQENTSDALAAVIGEIFRPRLLSPDVLPPAPENPRGKPSRAWDREVLNPALVLIPAGPFVMGSDPALDPHCHPSEFDQHERELPAYYIGKYPVTVGEYRAFVDWGGYDEKHFWSDAGWTWCALGNTRIHSPSDWSEQNAGDDRLPITNVSWYEAHAYTRWLSKHTGRHYRLPKESEWEKAARGTDGRIYPWGNEWRDDVCNTRDNHLGRTTPVDYYSPHGDSPFEVADMIGNVREWCASKWRANYNTGEEDNDPEGDAWRVVRGAAFDDSVYSARCAFRPAYDPARPQNYIGFRVACDESPDTT